MKSARVFILSFLFCVLCFASATANSFDFQGRVRYQGVPYDGIGHFRFAMLNFVEGQENILWTNDGVSTSTLPIGAISLEVKNGLFRVRIGDAAIPNMAEIPSVLLNMEGEIYLRTWFKAGEDAPWEVLTPDTPLNNLKVISEAPQRKLVLYVNGETGNDHYLGLSPRRAKKTIQAAVDVVPKVLFFPAEIYIAPGIYRETVIAQGITTRALSSRQGLNLIGDQEWTPAAAGTPNVVIESTWTADSPTTHQPLGLSLVDSSGFYVRGIHVQQAKYGITVSQSNGLLMDCSASRCMIGFNSEMSLVNLNNCFADHNSDTGLYFRSCDLYSTGYIGSNTAQTGLSLSASRANISGRGEFLNHTNCGILVTSQSGVWFRYEPVITSEPYTGLLRGNAIGLMIQYMSYTRNHTRNTFTNNTVNTSITTQSFAF